MPDWIIYLTPILAGIAAVFAILAFFRAGRAVEQDSAVQEKTLQLVRLECDRVRQSADNNACNLRQELNENLRGFQETTLKAFRELGETLANQVKEFGVRLDRGLKQVDERTAGIGLKLDRDIAQMGQDANQHRDILRQTIETKLDDAATKQTSASKEAREEIIGSFRQLGGTVQETLDRAGTQQRECLDNVTKSLHSLIEKQERAQEALRQAVEGRLDAIRTANEAKLDEMRKTVDEKLQSTLDERFGQSFKLVSDQLQKVSHGLGQMQELASGVGDLTRVLTHVRPRGIWGETQLGSLLEDFLAPDQFVRNVSVQPNSLERVEFAIRLPRLTMLGVRFLDIGFMRINLASGCPTVKLIRLFCTVVGTQASPRRQIGGPARGVAQPGWECL